jgi:hypothetical protein
MQYVAKGQTEKNLVRAMFSPLPSNADIHHGGRHVSEGPMADIGCHLTGCEPGRRHSRLGFGLFSHHLRITKSCIAHNASPNAAIIT